MEILFLDRQDPYFGIFSISENSLAEFQGKKIFNLVLSNELIKVEWQRGNTRNVSFPNPSLCIVMRLFWV